MSYITPDDWFDISDDICSRPCGQRLRVVVIGSKNLGKSTFVRILTAKLLKSLPAVCTLETDCGQPDNTPPAVISYTSHSNGSHEGKPRHVIRSQRYLGFVNPAFDPFQYIETVENVFKDYLEQDSEAPLIVNCHGYGASVGLETWQAIITLVQPDIVVHILPEGDPSIEFSDPIPFLSKQYPRPQPEWRALSPIITIEGSIVDTPHKATSVDYRWIRFAQHFRPDLALKNEYRAMRPRDFFVFPYTRFIQLNIDKVKILFPNADNVPCDPLKAINQLVVALCDSSTNQFVCMAYVASYTREEIRLIIPPNIPTSKMESVDCIMRGVVNWSPRDKVTYKGKTTMPRDMSVEEPYFLLSVLGGVESGARLARTRVDLKRRRTLSSQ